MLILNQKAQQLGLFAFIDQLLDLVFPPRCLNCGRLDTRLCADCEARLQAIPIAAIPRQIENIECCLCTAPHEGLVRQAVHTLKYENGQFLAPLLAQRLAELARQKLLPFDMLIPVPMFTHRLTERGYNQARLLAEETGRIMGITCSPHALHRHRHTRPQVGLNATERHANVREAFSADASLVYNQHILLIDDVCTTGATLSACAEALLSAGSKAVYGLTVTAANHSSVHQ